MSAARERGRPDWLPRGGERGEGLQHQHLPGLHPLERVVRLLGELRGRPENLTAGVRGGLQVSLSGGQSED